MRALLLAIVVVAACGRSDSKPAEPKHEDGKHEDGKHEEGEHHEMAMPPALDAFHKILAPHWHAAPGDQRTTDTCNAIPDFTRGAATVGAQPLVDAVKGLADACAASPRDPAKFDAAFQKVHEAFHAQLGEHE